MKINLEVIQVPAENDKWSSYLYTQDWLIHAKPTVTISQIVVQPIHAFPSRKTSWDAENVMENVLGCRKHHNLKQIFSQN